MLVSVNCTITLAVQASAATDRQAANLWLQGRRVVIFVIGGITRSELRVAHLMSAKLGRDVVLGSNVVDTPKSYLSRLAVSTLPRTS